MYEGDSDYPELREGARQICRELDDLLHFSSDQQLPELGEGPYLSSVLKQQVGYYTDGHGDDHVLTIYGCWPTKEQGLPDLRKVVAYCRRNGEQPSVPGASLMCSLRYEESWIDGPDDVGDDTEFPEELGSADNDAEFRDVLNMDDRAYGYSRLDGYVFGQEVTDHFFVGKEKQAI